MERRSFLKGLYTVPLSIGLLKTKNNTNKSMTKKQESEKNDPSLIGKGIYPSILYRSNLAIVDGKVIKDRNGKPGRKPTLEDWRRADLIIHNRRITRNNVTSWCNGKHIGF